MLYLGMAISTPTSKAKRLLPLLNTSLIAVASFISVHGSLGKILLSQNLGSVLGDWRFFVLVSYSCVEFLPFWFCTNGSLRSTTGGKHCSAGILVSLKFPFCH